MYLYLRSTPEQLEQIQKVSDHNLSYNPGAGQILLVEDYEPNILVASTYLRNAGFSYEVSKNGLEAVERAKSSTYSAILMDVQMPGMNGFEVTHMIRQFERQHGHTRTPIIGMTAHALAGDRERCLAAGMDDYIAKPVSEEELVGKLKLHINEKAAS